ncbi:MAG: hypothetical protein SGILL_009862 [Bacillariaceae sp.]
MVLRSLKDVEFWSDIPLATPVLPSDALFSDLEAELLEETVVLNEFSFKPLSSVERKDKFIKAGFNSGCLVIMKGLAESLCDDDNQRHDTNLHGRIKPLDSKALYEKLVVRLTKSSAAATGCSYLESIVGTSDLMVRHVNPAQVKVSATPSNLLLKASSSESSSGSENSTDIHVNLYESEGSVHMILNMTVKYGLFRKSDISTNRPWITLRGDIYERANLTSGASVRTMSVKTPNLY